MEDTHKTLSKEKDFMGSTNVVLSIWEIEKSKLLLITTSSLPSYSKWRTRFFRSLLI